MNPITLAITTCGSQKALAARLGAPATQSHVSYWLKNGISKKWAEKFSDATDGVVTKHDLRPDIFGPPPEEMAATASRGKQLQAGGMESAE